LLLMTRLMRLLRERLMVVISLVWILFSMVMWTRRIWSIILELARIGCMLRFAILMVMCWFVIIRVW